MNVTALEIVAGTILMMAAIGFGTIYLRSRRNKALGRALREVASEIGFKLYPDRLTAREDGTLLPGFFKFGLDYYRGGTRTSGAVLAGQVDGNHVVLFDQKLIVGQGTNQLTVACFQVETKIAPFHVRPKKVLDKVFLALWKIPLTKYLVYDSLSSYGTKDINFHSDWEFSENYRLTGPDENAIRALFLPGILNFFKVHKGWSVDAGKEEMPEDFRKEVEKTLERTYFSKDDTPTHWIVVYRLGQRIEAAKIAGFLDETTEIFRVFEKQLKG